MRLKLCPQGCCPICEECLYGADGLDLTVNYWEDLNCVWDESICDGLDFNMEEQGHESARNGSWHLDFEAINEDGSVQFGINLGTYGDKSDLGLLIYRRRLWDDNCDPPSLNFEYCSWMYLWRIAATVECRWIDWLNAWCLVLADVSYLTHLFGSQAEYPDPANCDFDDSQTVHNGPDASDCGGAWHDQCGC